MKFLGMAVCGIAMFAACSAFAEGELPVLATQGYVDSMYGVIDGIKADKTALKEHVDNKDIHLSDTQAADIAKIDTIESEVDKKVDAKQEQANAVVVTDASGNVTTAQTIDLTKVAVPASCTNSAALCVLAFRNGAWTVVDVTADDAAQ